MRPLSVLLAACLLVGVSLPAHAQTTWQNQIAVTGGVQFPMSTFADSWKTGSGFDGTYYYRPSSNFFFGLRSGYHQFREKNGDGRYSVIPIHFASKYNLSLTGLQPYFGLDGGLYLVRPKDDKNTPEFGLAPQFGFRLPIASGVDIDLNVTYEVILRESNNTTYIGLNAGFAYIFGR